MAVVVEVLAYLLAHPGQFRRVLAPLGVLDDLGEGHLVLHGGQAALVLARAVEGDQQAPGLGLEAEDEVVLARLRIHVRGEEAAEALLPVRAGGAVFGVLALLLAQLVDELLGQGRDVAAHAGEGVRAVALALHRPVGDGEVKLGGVDLKVVALDIALDFPDLAFLNVDFLHAAFGEDVAACIPDVFRDFVMEERQAHFQNDVVFRSAHGVSCCKRVVRPDAAVPWLRIHRWTRATA